MGFNIQLFLKDKDAPSTSLMLVCYHRTFKSGRFKFYLPSVKTSDWDEARQKHKDRAINDRLQWIKTETAAILTRQAITDQSVISSDWLREKLNALIGKPQQEKKDVEEDFFTVWDRIIIQTKHQGKPISPITVKNKRSTMFRMKEFAEKTGWKPSFKNIDRQFYNDFSAFLRQRGITVLSKHVKDIKAVCREAMEYGILVNEAVKSKTFKVVKEAPKDSVYLTLDDIERLLKTELPSKLANVRDSFVMACFCGLRHSDWKQIHPDNILNVDGRDFVCLTPQKTGNPVRIPVHPIIRAIIAKHNGRPPRVLTNQKTNRYIKDIAEKAQLGKVIVNGQICDKADFVTSHVARRSFATNSYLAGMDLRVIMSLTGHRSEASFRQYLKLGTQEKAMLAAQSSFFDQGKLMVAV